MENVLNILLVEDSRIMKEVFDDMINIENKNIIHVRKLEDALNELHSDDWNIILLDLNLLDSIAMNTISHISIFNKYAPVLVLTSEIKYDEEIDESLAKDTIHKAQITSDMLTKMIYEYAK